LSKKVIRASDLDANFKFEIAKTPEGRTLLWCVQCGMCSSNCPYSEVWEVKPHQVIAMVLLGMREEALSCESIWTCATCFMCAERCPQGVEITNVMYALKNIAAREKGVPEGYRAFGLEVYRTGRGVRITSLRERERSRMGLPGVPEVDVESVRRLLKKTKLKDLTGLEDER
jgi:heterodisulfide reductase subunit C